MSGASTGPGDRQVERAADLLRAGELVAFPTETVYGLGADASNPAAVARVFAVKGRPAGHPLIVHLASADEVGDWASEFPPAARRLAQAFWPGPLTLVLPRRPGVSDAVTGGQPTIALRVPAHPLARALLRRFGGGIAAPSANRYGRVSPTRASHVVEELGDRVAMVLDGGPCEVGLESTIVACLGDEVLLLRPGRITAQDLQAAGVAVGRPGRQAVPRVPGSMRSHYAPATPMEVVSGDEAAAACMGHDAAQTTVLARRPPLPDCRCRAWRQLPADAAGYGQALYATLRELDRSGASRILVERVPAGGEWAAVRDRLERAARRAPPDAP